ncbi:NATD1 family protein [Megaselia abdita]
MLSQLTKLTLNSTFRSSLIPKTTQFILPIMNQPFATQSLKVEHEPLKGRFTINHEGLEAKLLYKMKDQTIEFTHTGVPKEMEGKGVGKVLAKEGLQFAKDKNLKIEVSCAFVKHYIEKYEPHLAFRSKV